MSDESHDGSIELEIAAPGSEDAADEQPADVEGVGVDDGADAMDGDDDDDIVVGGPEGAGDGEEDASGSPSLKRPRDGEAEEEDAELNVPASSNKTDKHKLITTIPLGRVKKIAKQDSEVKMIGQEAVSIITRATEIFLRDLTTKAMDGAMQDKKKSITFKHISDVVHSCSSLEFLTDLITAVDPKAKAKVSRTGKASSKA